jgi:hypothetical protein
MNLIRMRIGKAATKGALSSPLFKTSWNLRSDQELLDLYVAVTDKMEEKPYGMWDAVNMIFGRDVADRMADQQEYIGRKLPKGILMKFETSGSKGETIDDWNGKLDDTVEMSEDERRYEKRPRL